MSLWVVVGGQFGSEGKGKVSAFITKQENIDICVRCGGPNSGHSFVDENGRTIILRQLPTGYVRSKTRLLIPAGALIDLDVLRNEIEALRISPERIGVDPDCFIIDAKDRDTERALKLRERLSSTLCGVGSAVSRRVLRSGDAKLAKDVVDQYPWLRELLVREGVSAELNAALDDGKKALIEGTQGFGLSLYHSGHYPYCTSRDTTAAGFLSEVGVSPLRVTEIVVVFRTFPIRVAGSQAGPLRDEIDWETVRKESGYPHAIEEWTSVTNKVRRVARFDWDLARKAVQTNGPTCLAINGLDYLNVKNRDVRQASELTPEANEFLQRLEDVCRISPSLLGTGPTLDSLVLSGSSRARQAINTRGSQAPYDLQFSHRTRRLAMDPALHEEWKYKDPNPDRGILLANQIGMLCDQGLLISKYYKQENLRPAAYTLRIGDDYIDSEGKRGKLSDKADFFVFKKNSIVFVSTKEGLDIPYYIIARFNLRVNWVYAGILLGTGPQVDPGFSGTLSCPLYNLTNVDIVITRGEDFATIDFEKTTALLERYPDAEEKKKTIQNSKDKQLVTLGGETWSFYKLPPMVALKWHKPYKIVSSLIEMKQDVNTWRRLGIGSVIAFLGLTLSLLAFGVNLYRQNSDLNRQNTDLNRQVTDAKNELRDAVERISKVEKDLDRVESATKQGVATSHLPDLGKSEKGPH